MGLKDYFQPHGKATETQNPVTSAEVSKCSLFSELASLSPTPPRSTQALDSSSEEVLQHRERTSIRSPSFASTDQVYATRDNRKTATVEQLLGIKADLIAVWLHDRQRERTWTQNGWSEGVILRRSRNDYVCRPLGLEHLRNGLFDSVQKLNAKCALTISTEIVSLILREVDSTSIPLENGLQIQVLPDITYLPGCHKHQFGSFIREPSMLVVWDDDPNHLLTRAEGLENQLMSMMWHHNEEDEKNIPLVSLKSLAFKPTVNVKGCRLTSEDGDGNESVAEAPRRIVLIQSVVTAVTIILILAAIGSGWKQVAMEMKVDKAWIRLAFLVAVPAQIWLALFFMQSLVGCAAQIVGPISQMTENTKFFSGKAPLRLTGASLPHVTIQCPIYKEGLWSVIDPTVKSIKEAICTYEMQGGSANLFVNDDGMQLISDEQARERREYYEEHNIGWVARPRHNPQPTNGEKAFVRAGKFKKASNMNHALYVSARVEDRLASCDREPDWTFQAQYQAYDRALAQVIEEDQGRTWAEGNIRVGDYILLIDSDTRVPTDCFLDAVSEMELSPQVAILQFSSGVMNITTTFFETGITFFTNLVYTAIQFAVANGDVAPFVGHNAFLRWSAVQDIAYIAEDGITEKYWSECTVSEDFDMALRLQTSGYLVRLAAYAGQGFKEGVSLTVYDELARWEKYAYGCNELIFHPVRYWIFRGPFTPLFRRFICSNMPLPSKITIMAYVGTYYAIGSAWILTMANYLVVGWFNGWLDLYYVDSFKIYFAIVIIFSGLGSLALAVLRYRIEERSLFGSLLENIRWVPLLTIYLGGISLHVSQALLSHMFSLEMSWGATAKEAKDTSFFAEVPVILKKFKFTFVWCVVMIATMLMLAGIGPLGQLVPYDWHINFFTAIWPLATVVASHFLLPIILNPGLMMFTWSMTDAPPPTYEDAIRSGRESSGPQFASSSTHLDIPRNGISPRDRRSMEDEGRPLPPGWVRQYDANESHQFFVDTTVDPPRSIWQHPYDDEQYLSTLNSEERERLQATGRGPNAIDVAAESSADELDGDHVTRTEPSPAVSGGVPNELPDRPQEQNQSTGGLGKLGSKMKDVITGKTREEREQGRRRRAEEEAEAYRRYTHVRSAMTHASQTGEPQLLGKNSEGQDVYLLPQRTDVYSSRLYPGAYAARDTNSQLYNPYTQGPYANPSNRFVDYPRPNYPYARPGGYGYGGGMGVPLAAGHLGAGGTRTVLY